MAVRSTLALNGLSVIAFGAVVTPAVAAAPPADTIIGNQAIATYQNAAGETITVESNLVETVVNQVLGVTIEAPTTKEGAPGSLVYVPHVITNTGNGPDQFNLTNRDNPDDDANEEIDFTGNITVYPDANLDGVPDSLTPITQTPSLNPGETFGVVVETNIPANASPNDNGSLDIDVISTNLPPGTTYNATTPAPGTDRVKDDISASTGAIIELTKSMTPSNASIGDTVTVTLTYTNTGLADATNVRIADPLSTELDYTAGSAQWSDTGALVDGGTTTTVDGTNGSGHTIAYVATPGATATDQDQIEAVISSVPAGRSASVTFAATVTSLAEGTIENIATVAINGGTPEDSNPAQVVVDPTIAFTLADSSSTGPSTVAGNVVDDTLSGNDASATDDETAKNNDIVVESGTPAAGGGFDPLPQGAEVSFDLVFTNHSNQTDTINLDADSAGANFPAGTTFRFVDVNGVPLTDSDGDGNPDFVSTVDDENTAGTNEGLTTVRMIADLPNDASSQRAASDTPWDVTVTARSSADPSVFNETTARINAEIIGDTVDLENGVASGPGITQNDVGNGPFVPGTTTPSTIKNANPGDTVSFDLVVENTGSAASSYDLAFSSTNAFGSSATALPSGFQVRFLNSAGVEISNTGLIPTTQTATVKAEIVVPAGATPQDVNIWFQALSPTNGAVDVKLDRIVVQPVTDVSITPDARKQAAPGGVVVLPHTITNNGNQPITEGALTSAGNTDFTSTLFYDANNNGVLDPTDPVVTNINEFDTDPLTAGVQPLTLNPGDSATIFNRVQVPLTAAPGATEVTTVTLSNTLNQGNTTTGTLTDQETTNNAIEDAVTIVDGDVELLKEQAIDATCSGSGSLTFTQGDVNVDPGGCIRYRVTATNTGTADATQVQIKDSIPAFTTHYPNCTTACPATAVVNENDGSTTNLAPANLSAPACGATGQMQATAGTLEPGETSVLQFTVRVDSATAPVC